MPLFQDRNGVPFDEALPLLGQSYTKTFGAVASGVGPFQPGTKILTLVATQACFIRLGDANTIVKPAGSPPEFDLYVPANIPQSIHLINKSNINHPTHISVIRDTIDGTLYISERE